MTTLSEGTVFQLLDSPIIALVLGTAYFNHHHYSSGDFEDEDAYLCWTQGKLFIYTHISSKHKGVMTEDMYAVTEVFPTAHIPVPVDEVTEGQERAFVKLVTANNHRLEDEYDKWHNALSNV